MTTNSTTARRRSPAQRRGGSVRPPAHHSRSTGQAVALKVMASAEPAHASPEPGPGPLQGRHQAREQASRPLSVRAYE